ncbi:MoaD/ThiS family protein [Alteromonas sp. A081]|uniref:MoaD/ThiS family protein n=1 Tax=Alteromonas sp. A081 TaxID=3410269 RepID=UPI003B98534F|mmetsp:Transcript_53810/g.122687  ORF Transcript_53810/g.122687 Transcript_53810/m.122687 type:complete len:83 (+) Transcript_53810:1191-1439(+)
MQITVKTFAQTREISKTPSLNIDIDDGAAIADVIMQLKTVDSNWALALKDSILTAKNQQLCDSSTLLCPGDEVAFFPPVTGG